MCGRVVAHGGLANSQVDHGVDSVAYANRLLGDDLMGAHALDRVVATLDLGGHRVVIVAVQPSPIANLPAGFGVKGRVIEDDLASLTRLEFLRTQAILEHGEDLTIFRARLAVAFKV